MVRAELVSLVGELAGRLDRLSVLAGSATTADRAALEPELGHYRHRVDVIGRRAAVAPASDLAGIGEVVRAMFGLVAGVEGAVEWHSPPRSHAGTTGVGLLPATGPHDYQRDRCPVVGAYERAWVPACVDHPSATAPPRALAFASGMAAMGTVLAWLAAEGASRSRPGPVLVARTTYHETRILLGRGPLARRIRWVERAEVPVVLRAFDRHRPSVVLVDAQANGPSLELADLDALLAGLADRASVRRPVAVVVDTTMLGVRSQPFRHHLDPRSGLRLLSVESLTKFAQLGLDRVAAGVVVAHHDVVEVLDDWREHLGTNATTASVRQLPWPDRARLDRRWLRHEAGAAAMASALDRCVGPDVEVVHPGLPGHRSRTVARRIGTTGASVALVGPDAAVLDATVQDAVDVAAARGLPLAEGTSFGFDATRLSVISPLGQPAFLRVAPGAGPTEESTALAEVLADALGRALRDA